jgi:hypothetical protein
MKAGDIFDLRTALEFLATVPGQLCSTSMEVDPAWNWQGVLPGRCQAHTSCERCSAWK